MELYRKLRLVFLFLWPVISSAQLMPSSTKMFAFRLAPGQDLKAELDNLVKQKGWKAVSVVTCVGSLEKASLRFADQKEATTLEGKFEIVSLTGVLSAEGSHLHISISDRTGKTIGGHLKEGSIVYTTAELVLAILEDYEFLRETDPTYGYKELTIRKK